MHLLLGEADTSLAVLLQERLKQENFTVHLLANAAALACVDEDAAYDLLLLDLNLPGITGADCLPDLRRRWPDMPIVLLSTSNSVEERVRALTSGADDFIGKPFVLAELVARVRAIVRRHNRPVQDVYFFEDLEINRVTHGVSRGGRSIELSPKEYALLEFLLRNPGHPVSRASIIEQVWRMHSQAITNVVDVYVNYLRRKIDAGSDRPLIRTVRGVGYQIGGNHLSALLSGSKNKSFEMKI
jgi:DNA-binding response OmpR family regulator